MGYSILPPVLNLPEGHIRKIEWIASILVQLALVALWAHALPWDRVWNGENDFLSFYAGAKLAGSDDLYSPEAASAVQRDVTNLIVPAERYIRPPFWAVFMKPLSWLSFRTAWRLFLSINIAALALFLFCFSKGDWTIGVWGAITIPIVATLANGQDVFIAMLICGFGILLANRGRAFAAGLLLSLCAMKFHLFLMIPVMLVARRQWRLLGGGVVGIFLLLVISTIAQGPAWFIEYTSVLRSPEIDPTPYVQPNLAGIVAATIGKNSTVELTLALIVAGVVAYGSIGSKSTKSAFAVAIAGGLLTSHHAYIQDCSLLLLAAALIRSEVHLKTGILVLMSAPFYFLLDAGQLGILLPVAITAWMVWASLHRDVSNESANQHP